MATYDSSTVKFVQEALNKLGASLVVDGLFGTNTKNAIISYQQKNGLLPTGSIDTDLVKALSSSTAVSTSFSMSSFFSTHGKKLAIGASILALGYGIYFINALRKKSK